MTLSNNAIKFLMAQYRAIFKRAYIKGLATAVLLTAGLAAGQAQAAAIDFDASYSADDTEAITVTDTSGTLTLDNTTAWANGGLNVQNSGSLSVTGTGTLAVAGNLTLNNADLIVSGNGATAQIVGTTDFGMESGNHIADVDFNAINSDITVGTSSSISFASVNISGGTINLSGSGANIYAYGTGYDFVTGNTNNNGELTLNDADVLLDHVTISSEAKGEIALGAFDGMAIRNSEIKLGGEATDSSSADTILTIVGAGDGDANGIEISDTTLTVNGGSLVYLSANRGEGTISLNNVTMSGHHASVYAKGDTYVTGKLSLTGHIVTNNGQQEGEFILVGVSPTDMRDTSQQTYTSDFIADDATITLTDASVGYANASFNGGSLTIKGTEGHSTSVWAYGEGAKRSDASGGQDSLVTIYGTSVNLQGAAVVGSYGDLTVTNATINASGTSNSLYAWDGDHTLSITDGNVDITSGSALKLGGQTIKAATNITIDQNATLTLVEGSGTAESTADLTGSSITNNGKIDAQVDHLIVDKVSGLYDGEESGSTLALSGDLTVNGEDTIDLTLAGLSNSVASAATLTATEATVKTDGNYSSDFANLDVGTLEAETADGNLTLTGTVTIRDGLTLTKKATAAEAAGISLLADEDTAVPTVNVSGTVTFGDDDSTGSSLNENYVIANDAHSLTFAGGDWSVTQVTLSSGNFSVDAGSVDVGTFEMTSGTATVSSDLTITDSAKVTSGSLTVENLGSLTLTDAALDSIKDSGGSIDDNKWSSGSVTLAAGSTLNLDLGTSSISGSEISDIVGKLVGTNNGLIDVGSTEITDVDDNGDDFITSTELGNLANITSDALKQTTRVVGSGDTVSGGEWSGIASEDASVAVTGTTIINAKDGHFAWQHGADNAYGTVEKDATITVSGSGSVLTLVGSGQAGDISGTPDTSNNDDTLNFDNVTITAGAISAFDEVNVTDSADVIAASVAADTLNVDGELDVTNDAGNATVSVTDLNLGGYLEVNDLTFESGANVYADASLVADTINIATSGGAANFNILGKVTADTIKTTSTTNNGAIITVGSDTASGVLEVGTLDLNSGRLIVDPSYDLPASVVAVTNENPDGTALDVAVNINGSALIGRNSMVGIGIDEAGLRSALSSYIGANGALSEELGSILYLNEQYSISASKYVYLDSEATADSLEAQQGSIATNSFTLGTDSALVLSSKLTDSLEENGGYAINFLETTGDVKAEEKITFGDGSKIIFESGFVANDTVNLFGQTGRNNVIDLTQATGSDSVTIEAAGGLVQGKLNDQGQVVFSYDRANGERLLTNVSSPVKELMHGIFSDEVTGAGAGYDYIVDTGANNGGAAIEQTSRLAIYGGAVQAALIAQQTSTDAVAERIGMANPNSALITSSNGQGAGLWLAPVYKNSDSDGFEAQGVDYGADIDLYGVALGGDYTLANGVRLGALFNFGSGEADGQGIGSGVTNDFDYYGFTLYSGVTYGNFALTADAGFTQASHDLEQSSSVGKLLADTDTQSFSLGLRAEYLFATPWVDVVPHLGVRYTSLDMDSYDVVRNGTTVATADSDSIQVFSIPFGVTFSKDIAMGDWSVKPVFDINLTANTGDDELDGTTTFVGVPTVALSTEIMDSFTYGTSLGIDAQFKEAFSFGLNVGYTGSSNVDEFGVNANARYTF